MKEKTSPMLSRHNLSFLLLCLASISTLYVIGVFPLYSEAKYLQNRIPELQQKVSHQQEIKAMLSIIDGELNQHSANAKLPQIKVTPLPQAQTDQILPDFNKIAANSKMNVIEVTPQLKKTSDLKILIISATLEGDFKNIRTFLYDLLNLTYLTQIKTVEIKDLGEQLLCKLTYTVNLS